MRQEDTDRQTPPPAGGTSPLEWATAAVAAAILVATVGYMAYYGLTQPGGPPKIVIETGATVVAPGGFVVEFIARNDGYSTAAGLQVTGTLRSGETVVEEGEVTIDYVPEGSTREGGFFFTRDPAGLELELRPGGYAVP